MIFREVRNMWFNVAMSQKFYTNSKDAVYGTEQVKDVSQTTQKIQM